MTWPDRLFHLLHLALTAAALIGVVVAQFRIDQLQEKVKLLLETVIELDRWASATDKKRKQLAQDPRFGEWKP